MSRMIESKRFRDLLRLMAELQRLHERLVALGQEKLDAIKRADVPAMRELTDREHDAARRIHEREGLRRQLMDGIGDSLGLAPNVARALPVSQLVALIGEQQGRRLREAADKLREAVSRVARVHRVVGSASRAVVGHLQHVFAAMTPAQEQPAAYADDGGAVRASDTRIFETVG